MSNIFPPCRYRFHTDPITTTSCQILAHGANISMFGIPKTAILKDGYDRIKIKKKKNDKRKTTEIFISKAPKSGKTKLPG